MLRSLLPALVFAVPLTVGRTDTLFLAAAAGTGRAPSNRRGRDGRSPEALPI